MKIDFSDIISILDKIVKETETVVDRYKRSKWEDEVKDSHHSFVEECCQSKDDCHSANRNLEDITQLTQSVQEAVIVKNELDMLQRQIDTVII